MVERHEVDTNWHYPEGIRKPMGRPEQPEEEEEDGEGRGAKEEAE